MKSMLSTQNLLMALLGMFVFFVAAEPALAANTSGGGLPFDEWFTNVRASVTGPFALAASIIGIVGAGATLIFGGDMNGFLRTLVFTVLVLSFLVAAQNMLVAITGQGAELATILKNIIIEGVA